MRRVEERLARDADYQAELQRLRTGLGPVGPPAAGHGRRVVHENHDRNGRAWPRRKRPKPCKTSWPRRQRRQRLWGALGGVLAAVWRALSSATALWPNPNEQLLEDLPVLQNFELYYQADNSNSCDCWTAKDLFAEGRPTMPASSASPRYRAGRALSLVGIAGAALGAGRRRSRARAGARSRQLAAGRAAGAVAQARAVQRPAGRGARPAARVAGRDRRRSKTPSG